MRVRGFLSASLALILVVTLVFSCFQARAIPPGSYLVYNITTCDADQGRIRTEALGEVGKHSSGIELVLGLYNFSTGEELEACDVSADSGEVRVDILGANSSFYTVRYSLILRNVTLACYPPAEGFNILKGIEWQRNGRLLLARLETLNVTRMLYVSRVDNGVYDEAGRLLGEWLFWLPERSRAQSYTVVLAHVASMIAQITPGLEGSGIATLVGVNLSKVEPGEGFTVGGIMVPPTSLIHGYVLPYGVVSIRYECLDEASTSNLLGMLKGYYASMPPEFKVARSGNTIVVNYTPLSLFSSTGLERKPWRFTTVTEASNLTLFKCKRVDTLPVAELGGRLLMVAAFSYARLVWERGTGVLLEVSHGGMFEESPMGTENLAVLSEYLGWEGEDAIYFTRGVKGFTSLKLVDTNALKPPERLGSPGSPEALAETTLALLALVTVALGSAVLLQPKRRSLASAT
ncbi:hypothetical protein [Infirmifilum sp. NZ]|uniref:hypothetical protein n=1 Tax=Infirmifilum sp. NZ TaxID=2926850 RepID=UPI00279CF656|nr:hypothetical protein [Infirmifilum sp. NZ]UNQ73694.1 hypothetical protein MOV14_01445 [Infirmifilum sp. NZ]